MTTRVIHIGQDERVETGPVKFVYKNGQEDWTGIFMRGDNAGYYSMMLERITDMDGLDPFILACIKSLINDLNSSFEVN